MKPDEFVEHATNFILARVTGTYDEELKRDTLIKQLRRFRLRIWENGSMEDVNLEDPAPILRWHAWAIAWDRGVMTRQREISAVKAFFRYMANVGAIRLNVTAHLQPPKFIEGPPKTPITREQYETIRDACKNPFLKWCCILAWHTGFALVDCCRFRWASVDLDRLMIVHARSKTASLCHIPIIEGSELHILLQQRWDKLQAERAEPDYEADPMVEMFVYPYSPCQFEKRRFVEFRKVVESTKYAGRPISFHCFRVAFCSKLANSQINSVVAMRMSGHTSAQVFQRYVKPNDRALHKALEIANETAFDDEPQVPVPDVNIIKFRGLSKPDINEASGTP